LKELGKFLEFSEAKQVYPSKQSIPLGPVFSRSGPYAMMGHEMEKSALMAI